MSRATVPFLSFNRGLLSPKALGRVDLDRTKLSAETFTNWLPSTQGSMSIRPGTKWFGSSLNDTGAEYLEFVASTDDVALVELTHEKVRLWLGEDAHDLALLGRPKVDTTVSITDTGWSNTSSGGAFATAAVDVIPAMTGATTSGVTISATSENLTDSFTGNGRAAWGAADDNTATTFMDTGFNSVSSLPTWWKVDFGASNTQAIRSYSIRAFYDPPALLNAPNAWTLQYNDVDTGDGWTTADSRSAQTDWAANEKRTFTRLDADTGTVEAFRYWRLNVSAINGGGFYGSALIISEIEMFASAVAQQVKLQGGKFFLNAMSIGTLARTAAIVAPTAFCRLNATELGCRARFEAAI